ncbi:hypothetical protein FRC06_005179 [Ceratobasidium sp. 370]|nr:hypothetical protein FRC06_005179 [Ceratobasidium sp. 370]
MDDPRKNVVIVGGGGGGIPVFKELEKQLDPVTHRLILIESRDYYFHLPAALTHSNLYQRMTVSVMGNLEESALIPYDRLFTRPLLSSLYRARALSITATDVITDKESVPYEYLILATGSTWEGPLNLPPAKVDAIEAVLAQRTQYRSSQSVLIVGGGAVGIELAGELREALPHVKVNLVHRGRALMNDTYPDKYRNSLHEMLTKAGVNVILNDMIVDESPNAEGVFVTASGQSIAADLLIPTRGGKPNTSMLAEYDPTAVIGETGYVRVEPSLRVKLISGACNVYAVGDIIDWPEQKMVYKAMTSHAPLVAKNIMQQIKQKKVKQAAYGGTAEAIFVTFGSNNGRAYIPALWGIVAGRWMVTKAKGKDLFVTQTRKLLGY